LRSIEDVNRANIERKSVEDKQKLHEKLHGQFYHPLEQSFRNLMMNKGAMCYFVHQKHYQKNKTWVLQHQQQITKIVLSCSKVNFR